MRPELDVELRVFGTRLDPSQITHLIGVVPTRTWTLGESIQKTNLRRKENAWCYSVPMVDEDDNWHLAKTVKHLLQVLLPKANEIRQICSDFDLECEVSCGVYVAGRPPSMNFTPDVVSDLAAFNATLDIDVILIEEVI